MHEISSADHTPGEPSGGVIAWWHRTPLYLRIVGALILGTALGYGLLVHNDPDLTKNVGGTLYELSSLILRMLQALATPLTLVAVIHALANARVERGTAARLFTYLITNTVVAICIGLLVANVVQPGRWGTPIAGTSTTSGHLDVWSVIKDIFPESLVQPLVSNKVMQVIVVALAVGVGYRTVRAQQMRNGETGYLAFEGLLNTLFAILMVVLHWIIDIIPFAVLGVVTNRVATQGFAPFQSLGFFILAVLLALALQAGYYLTRVRLETWVRPGDFLRGGSSALLTAFSTASSTATMPITYSGLKDRVGIRERSASMGALVGSNFNNDGTALYEAMAALFVAQMIGQHLSFQEQLLIVFTSVLASVGAAGIPEAGLVTMTLVFGAVHLPTQYILTLVTVDWFLDRCRTSINVMGDMTVSCLLDGKTPPAQAELAAPGVPVGEVAVATE